MKIKHRFVSIQDYCKLFKIF